MSLPFNISIEDKFIKLYKGKEIVALSQIEIDSKVLIEQIILSFDDATS